VNIAIFGGTFDPIHAGHLRAAQAAVRRCALDQVLFIPTGTPPHKVRDRLTSFPHRYTMVTLACADDQRFIPSLLESPTPQGRPHYSIVTTRKVRKLLGPGDRLFFLLGVDAFLDLPHWKEYRRLLDLSNWIVVSRPGFSSGDISSVVPRDMLRSVQASGQAEMIRLRHSVLHVIKDVVAPISSHEIREAISRRRPVTGLVSPLVEQYIVKAGLYCAQGARHL
jgi:nicotinate-nucleotide adenylyltransferase